MAVQEEINSKQIALIGKGTYITYQWFAKLIKEYQAQQKTAKIADLAPHGKQTVEELAKQGQGMTALDLNDADLRSFERIMKKYGVDFAIMTDKKTAPPTHTVFFKGKDSGAINKAFDDVAKSLTKKNTRPSVLAELRKNIEIVRNSVFEKVKSKDKELTL